MVVAARVVQLVFVIGAPCAGKTKLSKRLATELGFDYCSPSDWLRITRDRNTSLGNYLSRNYNYASLDPLVSDHVKRCATASFAEGSGLVVDGFPRTNYQAAEIAEIVGGTGRRFIVFDLDEVSREESIRRSLLRVWEPPHGSINSINSINSGDYHVTTAADAGRRYDIYETAIDSTRRYLSEHYQALNPLNAGSTFSDADSLFELAMETLDTSSGVAVAITLRDLPKSSATASATDTAIVIQTAMRLCSLPDHLSKRFPGSHPVSLQREHFETLRRHRYAVSKKWDGERVLVLIASGCVWILERNLSVTLIRFSTINRFDQTLLDCEWLAGKKRLCILDCIAFAGDCSVAQRGLRSRLSEIEELRATLSEQHFTECRLQTYYAFADMRHATTRIPDEPGLERDGLIFTPLDMPYVSGRDRNMFKWKPAQQNTVDVLWRPESSPRVFVRGDDSEHSEQAIGEITFQDHAILSVSAHSALILECLPVDASAQNWKVSKIRSDRIDPNAQWVAKRVCESIREDIQFEELMNDFDCVR